MQINPQVNTSIIRSVTLQHCPRGMCEFHPGGSQIGDNSSNQVPSQSTPTSPHPKVCMCTLRNVGKVFNKFSLKNQVMCQFQCLAVTLKPPRFPINNQTTPFKNKCKCVKARRPRIRQNMGETNHLIFSLSDTTSCEFLHIHWMEWDVNTKVFAHE